MSLFADCERCGCDPGYPPSTREFVGQFTATLCNRCFNAVCLAVRSLPEWREYVTLKARRTHQDHLATAGRPVDEADVIALTFEEEDVSRRLYLAIDKLIEARKAEMQAKADPTPGQLANLEVLPRALSAEAIAEGAGASA